MALRRRAGRPGGVLVLLLWTWAGSAWADQGSPDGSADSLFEPTPDAQMRAFSTDRPPKANSPYTVDAGHFQYETDVAVYAHGTTGATTSRDWTIVDPTLKLGLTHAVDAELQFTPYESTANQNAGQTTSVRGVGDTVARLKVNVLGDDQGDVAVALLPYLKLPTARSGLGNGKVEGGLILPIGINAPGGFAVIVMPEADALKDAGGSGYHGAFDFLVNISHAIGGRWTFYTEAYGSRTLQAGSAPVYTLDEAVTYAPGPNLQFDLGGNFSLNGAAPRVQLYLGISQRF